MVSRALVLFALLALPAHPAAAGPNANGAIIVHTNDGYEYLTSTVCATPFAIPPACEEAITRTDRARGAVVWLLAAFLPDASPSVASISFGIQFDDTFLSLREGHGRCGTSGFESSDPGWPSNDDGIVIGFETPVVGEHLFPFYFFRVNDFSGGAPAVPYLCSTSNPTLGSAAFYDEGFPVDIDPITNFGCVKWYAAGHNNCPQVPPVHGACCLTTGECLLVTRESCEANPAFYEFMGDDTVCVPDTPCPLFGACCDLETGACEYLLQPSCDVPRIYVGGSCEPENPCPQKGACCEPLIGACTFVLQAQCESPYLWYPDFGCEPAQCPTDPPGACCDIFGSCTYVIEEACSAPSYWQSTWTCQPSDCPAPVGGPPGPCCFADGHCEYLGRDDCFTRPGATRYIGYPGTCLPANPCAQPEACCDRTTRACTLDLESRCTAPRVFLGGPCEPVNPCQSLEPVRETSWGRVRALYR